MLLRLNLVLKVKNIDHKYLHGKILYVGVFQIFVSVLGRKVFEGYLDKSLPQKYGQVFHIQELE